MGFELVKLVRQNGAVAFAMMNTSNGKLLDWKDIAPTGNREIDKNIGIDRAFLVEKRGLAEIVLSRL